MIGEQGYKISSARHWAARSTFRLFALVMAMVQMLLFPMAASYVVPVEALLLAAVTYNFLKLLHPPTWHEKPLPNAALLGIDVSFAAALFILTGGIHSPFLLYTVAPVLSSALLLPGRTTLFLAGVTGSYVLAIFIAFSASSFTQSISAMNDFPFYITALGSAATLPYLINSYSRQRFQSSTMLKERHRLAHEIHDGLCQGIYAMRWQIQGLRRKIDNCQPVAANMVQMEKLLQEIERDARGSIELLSNFKIDRPFLTQIGERLKQLESDSGIRCRLEAEIQEPKLDTVVAVEAIHVCQEALHNAIKHSRASSIALKLTAPKGYLQITVADDGCGFDDEKTKRRGLTVMKERAESVGGRLKVMSVPGFGTQVRLEVPRL